MLFLLPTEKKNENKLCRLREFRAYCLFTDRNLSHLIVMSYNYAKGWAGPLDDIIFTTPIYIAIFSFFVSLFAHRFFCL